MHLKDYIRAYLQSKVETGVDILSSSGNGIDELSFEERLNIIESIPVGISGYFYAIDSNGVMEFHPDENLIGQDLAHRSPMIEQMVAKNGYLEYFWQNTYEEQAYKKALYMEYLPELDWIITATSYSRDFTSMVDMDAIRSVVLNGTVGETGYSWILDREGHLVVHPYLENPEDIEKYVSPDDYSDIVKRVFEQKDGLLRYQWPRKAGEDNRGKIMYLKSIPDFDWVVGTSIERSELIGPTLTFVVVDIGVILAVALLLSYFISNSNKVISRQIEQILFVLNAGRSGDLSLRIENDGFDKKGPDEINTISRQINYFLSSLQSKTEELQNLNDSLEDIVDKRTKELMHTSERLIESEKQALTSRLVAGVAHEINTPLGIAVTAVSFAHETIESFMERIDGVELSESDYKEVMQSVSDAASIAGKNLKRAGDLVMSFKSVSSDQLSLTRREFSLKENIDDVMISMNPMLKKKRIQIDLDIPDIKLNSYPGVFIHILVNFMTNTLNHGFAAKDEGRISLSAQEKGEQVVLVYRDDGSGIDPQVSETLFEPFVTTGRQKGNIGLGLNIVKNLVTEKLGGTIKADAASGGGAQFTICFPRVSEVIEDEDG